ncbi:MAG: peptidase M20, partial [Oscillospiraceae bacterium]|nr:peptidase M20 [Oscillospiraceae bacterium]
MKYLLVALAAVIVVLLAVIVLRTLRFKPKPGPKVFDNEEKFDGDKVVKNLQALVRCKTISNRDPALEDEAEFEKLINLLPELYPNVWEKCELMRMP